MTRESFAARFPEFAAAGPSLIDACLTEAEAELDVETWGAHWEAAHGLLAASKLTASPGGRQLRQTPAQITVKGQAPDPYAQQLQALQEKSPGGFCTV